MDPFTYTPTTWGYTFTYTLTFTLPCAIFNPILLTIFLPVDCCDFTTAIDTMTYTATLSDGSVSSESFIVTLTYTPKTIITYPAPDRTIDNSELPITISVTPFTYSVEEVGDVFAYTYSGQPPCASLSPNTPELFLDTSCAVSSSETFTVYVTGTLTSGET